MKVRKRGLAVMFLLFLLSACQLAFAATVSVTKTNQSASGYLYQKSADTTTASAIGSTSCYITQGTNPTTVSRTVVSELFVNNDSTGYTSYTKQVSVVRQASVCQAVAARGITDGDDLICEVTKYNSASTTDYKSASVIDQITIYIFNDIQ